MLKSALAVMDLAAYATAHPEVGPHMLRTGPFVVAHAMLPILVIDAPQTHEERGRGRARAPLRGGASQFLP